MKAARILYLDIETAPILAQVWGIWDQTVGLSQIKSDWHVIAWAAKWADSKEVMYMDQRNAKNIEDDYRILKGVWELLDQADIVVGQNSKKFDIKKLNSRFISHGMQPPSSFQQIDTLQLAKRNFSFTSNKLEYLSDKLCTKYKKLKHNKFPGFDMWKECLAGNKEAWREMERYNKRDVLSLEELYSKLVPWGVPGVNLSVYSDGDDTCVCGSKKFVRNGYFYSKLGKYQRYKCQSCGSEAKDRVNLLDKSKRKSMKTTINR